MTIRTMNWVICAVFACSLLAVSASAESKARIVRLSEVQGSVQMDRGTGDGFDKTFLNMPVIEGSRLKTGVDGRAEVEFEDGSALRIVPNSEVEFTRLALGDEGQRLTSMQLASGTAYVNYRGKKSDQFTLNFGHESVTVTEPAHFRIGLGNDHSTLAVIKGRVIANGQAGQIDIDQKHEATFDLNSDHYEVAKNYQEISFDEWDKEQSEYHDRYASRGNSYNSSPYSYGMSDLNYYGNFMTVPGYGMAWQPYFMDASWSPFQDGGWAFYPGIGYMWVSSYPWGWMPYRYGNWAFVPGYGWIWQPGYWNSWYPLPRVVNPPVRTAVPVPPTRGRGTVLVGRGLTVNPPFGVPRRVVVAPGSAGLGVPRGTVRNLDRASREVSKNNRPVTLAPEPQGRIAPPRHSSGTSGNSNSASSASNPFPSSGPSVRMPAPSRMPSVAPPHSSRPH
ncbi:MAG TPA: DUF6600 domain-containing protein [Terriglobales bacterium]|nr:DUF6600 domain-containing protein [Terriglobales bacterium]